MLETVTYVEKKNFALYDGTNSQDFLDLDWNQATVELDSEENGVLTLSWYDLNHEFQSQVSMAIGDRVMIMGRNEFPYSSLSPSDFDVYYAPLPVEP